MQIILALPAYNEAENLPPLIAHARQVFADSGLSAHIIIVNDGSTDTTAAVAEELSRTGTPARLEPNDNSTDTDISDTTGGDAEEQATTPLTARLQIQPDGQECPSYVRPEPYPDGQECPSYDITVIHHPENQGLGRAIMTGLRAAAGRATSPDDIIICMDADNTHSPDYIPHMAEKIWREHCDIVIASRYQPGSREIGVPPFRLLLSRGARLVFRVILRLPGVRDYTCGYRAYRASLIREALDRYGDNLIQREGFACTDELLVRLSRQTPGPRITEIPFTLRYDQKRSPSKLPLFKTIWETLKLLRETR